MNIKQKNLVVAVLGIMAICTSVFAIERPTRPVPPSLEIEVLDPGVDERGNPAVLLRDTDDPAIQQVDLPPTLLIHRYYYTGDRSFQAQILPGGSCIAVVNHPKTGERVYVPVQMLPGAPRVTYTGRSIEYDYGANAITIAFGIDGDARVRYRSGKTIRQHVGHLVHAEHLATASLKTLQKVKSASKKTATMVKGTSLYAYDFLDQLSTPIKSLWNATPLGSIGPALEQRVLEQQNQVSETQLRDTGQAFVERFQ